MHLLFLTVSYLNAGSHVLFIIIFRTSHGAEVRIQSLPQQFNKTKFYYNAEQLTPSLL